MMRRPLVTLPPISCNDACHKKRGSLGGTDYAVVVGTPVYAPMSGSARFRIAGTGGWTVTITNGGISVDLMHLSSAVNMALGGAPRPVTEGDLVAHSGGAKGSPGSGSATGPHLHANVNYKGKRYGMEEWLAAHPAGGGIPIEEEKMNNDIVNLVDSSTYKNGVAVPGTQCASILPSDRIIFYKRTMKDDEPAKMFTAKAGPHIVATHDEFIEWTKVPEVPPAGTVALGALKIETTGTIEPA